MPTLPQFHGGSGPAGSGLLLALLGAFLLFPGEGGGQEEVVPLLRGEARVGDGPLTQGTIVLHRVSPDFAGEVDSVQVRPDGTFQLRLPHVPDHQARSEIFFASLRFRGILYFGAAVTDPVHLDSLYLIQAYDTLSVPPGGAELPLSGRSVFLEGEGEGWRVTDLFQLRNETDRTLFSPDEGVVWSYPLPPQASDLEVGQGDLAPETLQLREGRLELFAPLPPGERVFLVRYLLPSRAFLLPLPGETERVEILVREPGPPVEFPPLVRGAPLELEPGTLFRRFEGEAFQDTEIRSLPLEEPWGFRAEWLGLLLAALLAGAGVYGYRRRGRRDSLLLAIARLDEAHALGTGGDEAARERHQEERERLLAALRRLG